MGTKQLGCIICHTALGQKGGSPTIGLIMKRPGQKDQKVYAHKVCARAQLRLPT